MTFMLVAAHRERKRFPFSRRHDPCAMRPAPARTTAPGPSPPCTAREHQLPKEHAMTTLADHAWRELSRTHELLTDHGVPRHDDNGIPMSLSVRVRLLVDESNSVRAELNELLETITP